MKILIADDDAVSRTLMKRLLVQCGYEVSTVSNGSEVVERLMEPDGPRLLLLDWMMPGLDGPEVCRAIRTEARLAYIYITLLTSKNSKEDLVAGLEAGADDYLTKPCNLEELKARLRTGMRILQLEDILVSAREEMRRKAMYDALTGLLNRGAIVHDLNVLVGEAVAGDKEFAVLLCDVDHFKRVNDTYGHPVGDEVLREIAARLKGAVRGADEVGRFGGEEFLVILKGCKRKALGEVAEFVCRAVGSQPVMTSAGPLRVSISAGVGFVGQSEGRLGAERILAKVDAALYEAKAAGRNRGVLASLSELVAVA